jgi:hypothetical protein
VDSSTKLRIQIVRPDGKLVYRCDHSPPIIIPTAKSTTLPRKANSLNSLNSLTFIKYFK